MLTEQEVARTWGQFFKGGTIDLETFERAEQLLDELRPESPLRHRLTMELDELRSIHVDKLSIGAQS